MPSLDDLALQACDDADNLNAVMRAYTALEKLVDTGALNDSEEFAPTRTELSALLRLLNEALMTRIATVNTTAGAVRDALQAQPSLKPV
ncbi:hypothetical protein [Acidovorax cavernicola]|uniref:hypothetical protein n=1 Tax=Acidovorax cavernicola TaxID=1675792 RepID=UPI002570E490|nr:hypothetical protein [Acidovorax cavernicola]